MKAQGLEATFTGLYCKIKRLSLLVPPSCLSSKQPGPPSRASRPISVWPNEGTWVGIRCNVKILQLKPSATGVPVSNYDSLPHSSVESRWHAFLPASFSEKQVLDPFGGNLKIGVRCKLFWWLRTSRKMALNLGYPKRITWATWKIYRFLGLSLVFCLLGLGHASEEFQWENTRKAPLRNYAPCSLSKS